MASELTYPYDTVDLLTLVGDLFRFQYNKLGMERERETEIYRRRIKKEFWRTNSGLWNRLRTEKWNQDEISVQTRIYDELNEQHTMSSTGNISLA